MSDELGQAGLVGSTLGLGQRSGGRAAPGAPLYLGVAVMPAPTVTNRGYSSILWPPYSRRQGEGRAVALDDRRTPRSLSGYLG